MIITSFSRKKKLLFLSKNKISGYEGKNKIEKIELDIIRTSIKNNKIGFIAIQGTISILISFKKRDKIAHIEISKIAA